MSQIVARILAIERQTNVHQREKGDAQTAHDRKSIVRGFRDAATGSRTFGTANWAGISHAR